MSHNIILQLILIFAGASILATLFLYLKQPIILAYIALGMIVGPSGLKLLEDPANIEHISQLGIILLVFLLGLNLHLQKLYKLLRQTALVTAATSAVFAALATFVALAFRFPPLDSLIVGLALMFSSTVICIKLVPTTTLHQKHMGEVIISILLLQDIIAIALMLFLYGNSRTNIFLEGLLLTAKTLVIAVAAFLAVNFGLSKVFRRFDVIQDYLFLVSLGWCLLVAGVAHAFGISYEIGAFIAGISLGSSPIALFIAEGLKPVREFFLILFFFAIGARFDLLVAREVLVPGLDTRRRASSREAARIRPRLSALEGAPPRGEGAGHQVGTGERVLASRRVWGVRRGEDRGEIVMPHSTRDDRDLRRVDVRRRVQPADPHRAEREDETGLAEAVRRFDVPVDDFLRMQRVAIVPRAGMRYTGGEHVFVAG